MTLPLKGAAVGLLIGILLAIFLQVETVGGIALLIIICMLAVTIIFWIAEALLRWVRRA